MEVLIQGLEFTNRLHLLLLLKTNLFEQSALDLTTKIHQSFTTALSLLNTSTANNSIDKDSVDNDCMFIRDEILSSSPVTTGNTSSNADQFSGENKNGKAFPGSSTDEDPKVGCKKRKSSSHTWIRKTSTAIDDGHAWRKYGQKPIYNSKFPRCYFRCSNKIDQDCQAIKHVQKSQEKPPMYQTTYIGQHTCKKTSASIQYDIPDHLMLDENHASTTDDSSCVLNFQTNITNKQPFTFTSSTFEHGMVKHNATSHDQFITPSDHDLNILLADLTAFDSISREVLEVLGI